MGEDTERKSIGAGHSSGGKGNEKKSFVGGAVRKKACRFCTDSDYHVDYKSIRLVQSFLTETGKILPRRISGTCARHQRKLTVAIKRARQVALLASQ